MSGQAGRYTRSSAGMVGALLVSLAVIVGFVAFRDVNRSDVSNPVQAVAYEQVARQAQQQADFEILAPDRLPAGWRVTSVRYTPGEAHWHLGLLTDEQRYVGVEQGREPARSMVQTYVDSEAVAGEPVDAGGDTWASWTDEDGDLALVREQGEVTTLVVGTAGRDALVQVIASLR